MAYRFTVTLCSALLIGVSAVACTAATAERPIPPAIVEEAEAGKPTPREPVPDPGFVPPVAKPFVFKAAPPGTFAQAVSAGGSVVKTPKIVPIFYANDPQKQIITDFTSKLATSAYWGAITAEYGVGALTAQTPIVLEETAPTAITGDQIDAWLAGKFTSDAARFGAPDSSTLYAIYFPPGTTVSEGSSTGCMEFGAYHYETSAMGTPISYAVMPRCAAFAGLAGADVTTFAGSHEILEWATDPFPATRPAYNRVDDDHAVWSRVFLGELGDLCTQLGNASFVPADLGVTVQRTWSNASASAGHHPCAPITKTPYFTAFPAKSEPIAVTDRFGRHTTTSGVKVGVGQKKTIELTMYSDAAVGSWTVQVVDLTRLYGVATEFSYELDKAKGTSGDTLQRSPSPARKPRRRVRVS